MHNYEIEIKVLLGDADQKDIFMDKIHQAFPEVLYRYTESQLNHYFEWGSLSSLQSIFGSYVTPDQDTKLDHIKNTAKTFSVRTRATPTQTIIVVKATVNDESSSNGTARIEWEVDLAPMTLDEMDSLLLEAGFSYQAKWSRDREWYELDRDIVLCLDKNAWYGYLAEFERVITDVDQIENTRAELLQIIHSLWYEELDQARLARMFDFYNKNWRDYYGTEEVFTLE